MEALAVLLGGHAYPGAEGAVVAGIIHKAALEAGVPGLGAGADHLLGKLNPADHQILMHGDAGIAFELPEKVILADVKMIRQRILGQGPPSWSIARALVSGPKRVNRPVPRGPGFPAGGPTHRQLDPRPPTKPGPRGARGGVGGLGECGSLGARGCSQRLG